MTTSCSINICVIDSDNKVEVVEFIPADIPNINVYVKSEAHERYGLFFRDAYTEIKCWTRHDRKIFLEWYAKYAREETYEPNK